MKRIFLFILTNIAVLFVINITLRLLGVDHYVERGGINFGALLVMSAVIVPMTRLPSGAEIAFHDPFVEDVEIAGTTVRSSSLGSSPRALR